MTGARQDGASVYAALRGADKSRALLEVSRETGAQAAVARLAIDFVYGKVWAREGLDSKQRSLVTIGALIALRQVNELENHIGIALANGLDRGEIEEAIIQTAPYAGFPAAWAAAQVLDACVKAGRV